MNYKILNTKEELIEYFCSYFIEQLISIGKPKLNIALSGGNTPKDILQRLSSMKELINWDKLCFYQVDERCVPPDSDQSNYKMIKESLLDNINLLKDNFHRIRGEEEPFEEVQRYGELIIEGNVTFDIILLGMGSDGHTASIFPMQFPLYKYKDVTAVSVFPGSEQKRITLTEETINNAVLKVFLVSGKDKADTVKKIFSKEDADLPASRIHGNVFWILDSDAAHLL